MAQRLICDSNRCAAELVGCSLASDERHRSLNRNASSASSDPAKRAASPQPCNTSEPDRQVRHRSACHNQRALPESGIPLFELVNSSFVSNLDGGQKKKLTLHFERAQCGSWLIVGRMHRFTLQLSSKDFFSFFGPKLQLKNVTFVVGTIFLCEGVLELFIFSRLRPREGSGWIVADADRDHSYGIHCLVLMAVQFNATVRRHRQHKVRHKWFKPLDVFDGHPQKAGSHRTRKRITCMIERRLSFIATSVEVWYLNGKRRSENVWSN